MHVGEHGDDVTRHAAPVGEGSAAGARVCEREVQRAEVMGRLGTVGVDTWYMLIHSEVECVIVSSWSIYAMR